MKLTEAVRVALMGIVFALVLSLALSPPADAQQTPTEPGQEGRRTLQPLDRDSVVAPLDQPFR